MSEPEQRLDWATIAGCLVHRRKLEIIRALEQIGRPLSASDLFDVVHADNGEVTWPQINWHVVKLEERGVLVVFDGGVEVADDARNVRSVYYTFAPEALG